MAGQTIMRDSDGSLKYLLTDHLGSTVAVTNQFGTLTSQQRYLPFGAPRAIPNSPILGTDFTYTGQRKFAPADGMGGIMDYRARFYSPYLNHFTQPDTMVSDPYNPQAWNRYAYVLNNPIRYTDPTGHIPCQGENWDDGPQCVGKPGWEEKATENLRSVLKEKYDWDVAEDFSLKELQVLYQTGRDIEEYADSVTGGNGLDWMISAFGNTTIIHGQNTDGYSDAFPLLLGGSRIRLGQGWLNSGWTPKEILSHELGHVWDINSGFAHSGKLNRTLGGSSWCFFCDPGDGVPQWDPRFHPYNGDAYGNSARNEYFAEAFSATIYNPTKAPAGVSEWIRLQISIDLIEYLFPGGIQ